MTTMNSGYKKMIWGIILSNVHINIDALTILPIFVGWLIVISGFGDIEESIVPQNRSIINLSLLSLFLMSFVESLVPFLSSELSFFSLPVLYYPVIYMIVEMTAFHKVLESSVIRFTEANSHTKAAEYIKLDKRYLLLMGAPIILLLFAITVGTDGMALVGFLMILIARVYLLRILGLLKNEDQLLETDRPMFSEEQVPESS